MKFMSLVLALLLAYQWRAAGSLQQDAVFERWRGVCQKTLAMLPVGVQWACVVLLPSLVVGIVIEGLSGWAWGALSLLLAVGVLLYSLGRGEWGEQVEQYLASWQGADWQGSWHHAQAFVSQESLDETTDPVQLHDYACRAIVYQGFERLFAVVFWFMILGPAGALFYRLASLQARDSGADEEPLHQQMLYLLEWLPARALAFTFALAGNFNTCLHALEASWLDMTQSIPAFLGAVLGGALQWTPLQFPESGDDADLEAFIDQGQNDVRALLTLLTRSGMIWLAVIAFWQVLTIW